MNLSFRKPRPLDRTVPHLRDTRLIVIATEGECTERQYFELFREQSTRVQILVLETRDGHSAPKHLFERLLRFKRDHNLIKGDQLWLVLDKDRWPDAQLSEVASRAFKHEFSMAVSTPCFDFWLYLHHSDDIERVRDFTAKDMKKTLRELLGSYNPSHLDTQQFAPYVGIATERARSLDLSPTDRWPNTLGTHVYRVIEAIKELTKTDAI